MGPLIKDKGKAQQPSFYTSTPTPAPTPQNNSSLILLLIVGAGVSYIWFMRTRTATAPALTLVPSTQADESTITNLTNSASAILALRSHAATDDT
jgi:hypothetical protein